MDLRLPGRRAWRDEGGVGRFWGSAASGVLFRAMESGRILLLKRSAETAQGGTWGIPGGAIPVDDVTGERMDSWQSARKEAEEESGWAGGAAPKRKHTWHDPAGSAFTYTTFEVMVLLEFEPDLSDGEHTEARWVTLDQAESLNLHPGIIWLLPRLRRGRRTLIRRVE